MKSRPISQHKGFALVIALMLMSFVTLILLSFSTLTQVGLHSANLEAKRFVARSNAQFALMQAIGKLQRMTGPDQRITASANIINTSGVYAEDRATEKRHWVGVWNTQELNESNDLQTQGRNTGSIDIYTDSFQGWLVSDGASPETIDSLSSILSGYDDENETSLVALLGQNSVLFQGSDDPTREGVYLLKSPIGDEGNYAFWVSDESLKANFSLEDPFQDAAANSIEKRYG